MLQGMGKDEVASRDEGLETHHRLHRGRCPGLPCSVIHLSLQVFIIVYRKSKGSVNVLVFLLKLGSWGQ